MDARDRNRQCIPSTGSAGTHAPVARASANPVLRLQRQIGNRATGQVIARAPATKDYGTVQVGKLPAIKIVGGNKSFLASVWPNEAQWMLANATG